MENKAQKRKECKAYVSKIKQMTKDLWLAVENEEFERAAILRDLIRDEQEAYKQFLLAL
jgi:protein-arginine kinase activator protein McsA